MVARDKAVHTRGQQDVLLRLRAPFEAEYPYRFRVEINQHGGEDECEC